MTMDTSQQRFGPVLSFDYPTHTQPPAFSNPWSASSGHHQPPVPGSSIYAGSQQPPPLSHNVMAAKAHGARSNTSNASSMASYGSMPVPPTSAGNIRSLNDDYAKDYEITDIECRSLGFKSPANHISYLWSFCLRLNRLTRQRPICSSICRTLRCHGLCSGASAPSSHFQQPRA